MLHLLLPDIVKGKVEPFFKQSVSYVVIVVLIFRLIVLSARREWLKKNYYFLLHPLSQRPDRKKSDKLVKDFFFIPINGLNLVIALNGLATDEKGLRVFDKLSN